MGDVCVEINELGFAEEQVEIFQGLDSPERFHGIEKHRVLAGDIGDGGVGDV